MLERKWVRAWGQGGIVARVAALVGGLFVGNITDRASVGRSSPRRLSHFGGLGISVHNARWRVPSPLEAWPGRARRSRADVPQSGWPTQADTECHIACIVDCQ